MFIHDIIKIKFSRDGYLPNLPYHLMSDEEMCDAFITLPSSVDQYITDDYFGPTVEDTKTTVDWFHAYLSDTEDSMFFKDNYPLIDDEIYDQYKALVNRIFYEIQEFKKNLNDDRELPAWIYSYMLGVCIGPSSDKLDIHDMISAIGTDNIEDEYNVYCAEKCLEISANWLKKIIVSDGEIKRPPTMFGEPHVLKAIRLDQESLDVSDLPVR